MSNLTVTPLDLTPPPFAEGLCDWSRGDGTPQSPTYETGEAARIERDDPDFGDCLELRLAERIQRLRYMGEMPLRPGSRVELAVRIKLRRGPGPLARIGAWPGGFGGAGVCDLPGAGPLAPIEPHGAVTVLRAVIGRDAAPGVDLVWDDRALFAHVGLDLIGPRGAVVRIENFAVRELREFARPLPGFEPVAP